MAAALRPSVGACISASASSLASDMSECVDDSEVGAPAENGEINSEKSQAIQILVFPPKNKKFEFDEETNSIRIEPLPGLAQSQEEGQGERSDEPVDVDMNADLGTSESVNGTLNGDRVNESSKDCESVLRDKKATLHVNEMLRLEKVFKDKTCFLKGCKWSPDGLCLVSNSEDNCLRLFEITESSTNRASKDIPPVLVAKEGGTIYDYEWYPKMNSNDPNSCVFVSTSQNSPIHLWDAYTGYLRATYQPINQYDEVTAAFSLAFSPDGTKIYSGFKKCIRIFDISLPGRVSEERNLKVKGSSAFQSNIISCIAVNPALDTLYALGSYDRTIGIYTEPEGELQCILKGHKGGLTHIKFSPDGLRLYSGGRKDPEIICWDLRNPGKILFTANRAVSTNQRIYFDFMNEGTYLITGSTDRRVMIYDTDSQQQSNSDSLEPIFEWKAHNDCVNGISVHPFQSYLATSSGQHHTCRTAMAREERDDTCSAHEIENTIKVWTLDFNEDSEEGS